MVHRMKKRVRVTLIGYYDIEEDALEKHYEVALGPAQWEEALKVDREQYGQLVTEFADGLLQLYGVSATVEYAE